MAVHNFNEMNVWSNEENGERCRAIQIDLNYIECCVCVCMLEKILENISSEWLKARNKKWCQWDDFHGLFFFAKVFEVKSEMLELWMNWSAYLVVKWLLFKLLHTRGVKVNKYWTIIWILLKNTKKIAYIFFISLSSGSFHLKKATIKSKQKQSYEDNLNVKGSPLLQKKENRK